MKEKTVIVLLIFSVGLVNAQAPVLTLGMQGGISVPMGTYAKDQLDGGAFTFTGGSTGFYLSGRVLKNLNLRAEARYTLHPVDAGSLANAKVAADQFLLSLIVRSEPYRWISAAAGPEYHFPLNNRFSFSIYGVAGMMWGKTPYQLYKPVYYMYGPSYYEITSSRDRSMFWSSGISFQVRITDCIRVSLGSSVSYSAMQFGFYTYSGSYVDEKNVWYTNVQGGLIIPIF